MELAPVIYEHAAALVGASPWEASRTAAGLARAHAAAWKTYRHAPVVAGIDVYNIEPEAYGAELRDRGGNAIPTVTDHPVESLGGLAALPAPDPESAGRMPMVLEAADLLRGELPEAEVRVPVSGPFAIASTLLGFEKLLMEGMADETAARDALLRLAENQRAYLRAIGRRGLQAVVFESGAAPPMLSPELFRTVELPALRLFMEMAEDLLGAAPALIIGGDTASLVEDLAGTGTGFLICPAETDQAGFMRAASAHPELMVRVNLDPGVFVSGDEEALRREVAKGIAAASGRERASLGTGVLPYDASPERVRRAQEILGQLAC